MGCAGSTQIAVTSDFPPVSYGYGDAKRRGSSASAQLTQPADSSCIADDVSVHSGFSRRPSVADAKLVPVHDSMNGKRLDTIISAKSHTFIEEIQESQNVSALAYNVKAKKYKSPYAQEDDPSIFDTENTHSELAIQEDSWYPKPRPKLTIVVDRRVI